MGPTWIVVVVHMNGGTTVEDFSDESAARDRYDELRRLDFRTVYLATVRSEAHR